MIKERIYAVVDLETTGPKQDGSDKIIQFSCDFVQSNKIVNHFSTLINPGMPIPAEVKKLTGIKIKMYGTRHILMKLQEQFMRCCRIQLL